MSDGIPTLLGDANDIIFSREDFQAAVEDCAKAASSNLVIFKEVQSSIYESGWV